MKQRHVSFTLTAQRHVAREKAWWLENRDYPEVFVEELEQALKVVAVLQAPDVVIHSDSMSKPVDRPIGLDAPIANLLAFPG